MIAVEDWAASGEIIRWRGHGVFVRATGAGQPLLLIHGFPTASWDWHRLETALAGQYRLIMFDLLGFGLSDKPVDGDYRIAAQADLAEAVLAHFGVSDCCVLAHDYGDTVAQELLARQSEGSRWTLRQLALLNGGLFPEAHRPRLIQRLLASPIGGLIARLTNYPRFAANMRQICRQPWSDAELAALWSLLQRQHGLRVMPKLIRYMAERRRHRERWVGALVRSVIPIRLINGLADPISGAHMVQRYRELVPNPDVVELTDVGHYPQFEAPTAVATALQAFLRRRSGA